MAHMSGSSTAGSTAPTIRTFCQKKLIPTQKKTPRSQQTHVFLCLADLGGDAVVRAPAVLGASPDEDHVLRLCPVREPFRQQPHLFRQQGFRENLTMSRPWHRQRAARSSATRWVSAPIAAAAAAAACLLGTVKCLSESAPAPAV